MYKARRAAHVELANKMKERNAGTAPGIGDRVADVMIVWTKLSNNYENSENQIYVLKNDLPISALAIISKNI